MYALRYGPPYLVGSRCQVLNRAVGGMPNSAHCTPPCNGLTADFRDLYSEFQTNRFFDQLISEKEISPGIPSWMHVGYEGPGGEQRRQFFVL